MLLNPNSASAKNPWMTVLCLFEDLCLGYSSYPINLTQTLQGISRTLPSSKTGLLDQFRLQLLQRSQCFNLRSKLLMQVLKFSDGPGSWAKTFHAGSFVPPRGTIDRSSLMPRAQTATLWSEQLPLVLLFLQFTILCPSIQSIVVLFSSNLVSQFITIQN